MSWADLEGSDPDLAATGAARLAAGYASLATTRRDGSPRVHPVSPLVGGGRLFVFMDPASPKGHDLRRDLRRDGRYALHSAVGSPEEGQAELLLTGRAGPAEDPAVRGIGRGAPSLRGWQARPDTLEEQRHRPTGRLTA